MDEATIFLMNAIKAAEDAPRLDAEAQQAAKTAEAAREVSAIAKKLRSAWREDDPGKYGPHWFLIRDFALKEDDQSGFSGVYRLAWCDRFWPRELVDDPAAAAAKLAAENLGSFSEAKKEVCLRCKNDGLLVGWYHQTFDSAEGDEWQIRLYAICATCPEVRLVARYADEYRCSHLLSRPSR